VQLYNLAIVFLCIREFSFFPLMFLKVLLKSVAFRKVVAITDTHIPSEHFLRPVPKLPIKRPAFCPHLLLENSGTFKFADFEFKVLIYLSNTAFTYEPVSKNAHGRETGSPIEIVLEVKTLLGVSEVVTPGEEGLDLGMVLVEAAGQIFAQAGFRGELAVVRVVVVEVAWVEV
jgi:hypothetical protein